MSYSSSPLNYSNKSKQHDYSWENEQINRTSKINPEGLVGRITKIKEAPLKTPPYSKSNSFQLHIFGNSDTEMSSRVHTLVNERGLIPAEIEEHSIETLDKNEAGSQLVSDEARNAAISNLDVWGITENQYDKICDWYVQNRNILETLEEPKHFHRVQNDLLPLSVIYVPNGPHQGLHVRSKVKIGIGSFNTATRMLHIDSGSRTIARSANTDHIDEMELVANRRYAEIDPQGEYFATGTIVHHQGFWRTRDAMEQDERSSIPKDWLNKTTIILEEQTGGELNDLNKINNLNKIQKVAIILHLTKGIALAHQNNLVEIDYKPQNIFMNSELLPRMGDFASTWANGLEVDKETQLFVTTLSYWPPEYIKVCEEKYYTVNASHQMWIHGLVIAEIFQLADVKWTIEFIINLLLDYNSVVTKPELDAEMTKCLLEKDIEGSVDWMIARCLEYHPEERISADELIPHLENLYNKLTA